jgi:hypothetical protein
MQGGINSEFYSRYLGIAFVEPTLAKTRSAVDAA